MNDIKLLKILLKLRLNKWHVWVTVCGPMRAECAYLVSQDSAACGWEALRRDVIWVLKSTQQIHRSCFNWSHAQWKNPLPRPPRSTDNHIFYLYLYLFICIYYLLFLYFFWFHFFLFFIVQMFHFIRIKHQKMHSLLFIIIIIFISLG